MAKALVLVPFALDAAGVANRRAQLKGVKLGPDISFDYRPVTCGPTSFMSPHDWGYMDLAILEAGMNAAADGYDAVCIDTMSDSGLAALRSVLDIPVISPGKSSMLMALTLGAKFSVLAQWPPSAVRYKKAVIDFGLAHLCASVRTFDTPPDFANLLSGKENKVFPKMRDVCMRCIEEDGADVICLGSTTMHQAAEYLAANLPVPLINPGPLTYKLVEVALGLGLSHSRKAYPKPLAPKDSLIHAMFRAGAAFEAAHPPHKAAPKPRAPARRGGGKAGRTPARRT